MITKLFRKLQRNIEMSLFLRSSNPSFYVFPALGKKPTCPYGSSNRHILPAKQPSACQQGGHPAPAVFQLQGEQGRSHPLHAGNRGRNRGKMCSTVSAASLEMSLNPTAEGFFAATSPVKAIHQLGGNICSLSVYELLKTQT